MPEKQIDSPQPEPDPDQLYLEGQQFLKLARRRLDYVPKMKPVQYADHKKQAAARSVTRLFFRGGRYTGFEHLETALQKYAHLKAQQYLEMKKPKPDQPTTPPDATKPQPDEQQLNYPSLLLISNHLTDPDHSFRRLVFENAGYKDVMDKTVFPAGFKMLERWYIKPFIPAEHALFIFTYGDLNTARKTIHDYERYHLTPSELKTLEEYYSFAKDWNEQARTEQLKLRKNGFLYSPYPEGTRSRDGKMASAPRDIARSFPRINGIIVPIVIDGLQVAFPPEKPFRWVSTKNTTLAIGPHFRSETIWQKGVSDRSNFIMAHIAQTAENYGLDHLLKQGTPEEPGTQAYFRSLLQTIR